MQVCPNLSMSGNPSVNFPRTKKRQSATKRQAEKTSVRDREKQSGSDKELMILMPYNV